MGSSLREALLPSRAFRRQPPGVMGLWQLRSHGAGVNRVLEDVAHPRAVSLAPDNLVRGGPKQGAHRQRQTMGPKVAHHGPRALEFAELGEDESETRLHLFVRVQDDRSGS